MSIAIRVFGWLAGSMSLLNLVEDVGLVRVLGRLEVWLAAYTRLRHLRNCASVDYFVLICVHSSPTSSGCSAGFIGLTIGMSLVVLVVTLLSVHNDMDRGLLLQEFAGTSALFALLVLSNHSIFHLV